MRFELDDDQQAIQRTAKEFLASRYPAEEVRRLALEDERGFTDEGWQAIAELGWPALVIGEDDGGLGLGVVELAVLQEQLGYALAPTPLLSTIAAALAISAAGDAEQRAQWLPALAEGERRGTVAPLPPADGLEADAHALTARLEAVPDAADADLLIVPTGHDDLALVELGGDGVDGRAGRRPRTRRAACRRSRWTARPRRRCARPTARPRAREERHRGRRRGGVGRRGPAGDGDGGRARARPPAVRRPIGVFQAVSHACAQMLLEVEGARSAVMFAAWALDN